MADTSKFVLYYRKFLKNPLMGRKQCVVELIHPESGSVSRAQVKEKLSSMMKSKPECITVMGLKTKYGGGRSTGMALIYDSADLKKKYDSKKWLIKDGVIKKDSTTRKQKKEIKGRQKKVRGIEKAKVASGGKKK
jgi:small subunit ribosomal protein S24e